MEYSTFSIKTMYLLGEGNEEHCNFDFSKLPSSKYEPFFNTLPNFLYKKVQSITFTNEFLYLNNKNDINSEIIVNESIFKNRNKFIPFLIKILIAVIPKTLKLTKIEFNFFEIPSKMLQQLFNVISQSKTLKSLKFFNIKMKEDYFKDLINKISPYQYEEIIFNNCSLSSLSFSSIISFLCRKPKKNDDKRKIKIFDVTESSITKQQLKIIFDLVKSETNINKLNDEFDFTIEDFTINTIESPFLKY